MGEINVKQNELSSLIRAAQYLKIKGLIAGDICLAQFGAMQVNESYSTVDNSAIKEPSKPNEGNKTFLMEEQVQVMPEYPVMYSPVKIESVNKNRVSTSEHEPNQMELEAQPPGLESDLKLRENHNRTPVNTKGGKKLKMLLQKRETVSA
ncbi:UNVERIFIED_CONTAM: hypothetical protein GTU68_062863, partial [Idotea baltica]|nr:hypothetical protein [Idotea baltica]